MIQQQSKVQLDCFSKHMFWVGMQRRHFSHSVLSGHRLLQSGYYYFQNLFCSLVTTTGSFWNLMRKCKPRVRECFQTKAELHWGAANSLQRINMLKYMQSFSHLRADWWICTSEMQSIDFLSLCREQCMHKTSPKIYLSLYCVIFQKQSDFYIYFV